MIVPLLYLKSSIFLGFSMKQTIIIQLSKLIHVHGRSTTFARNASPADRLVRTAPASV